MAAEIKNAFDVTSQMIEGRGGVFDVIVDGKKVYSKHETGRFPEDNEVIKAIEVLRKGA